MRYPEGLCYLLGTHGLQVVKGEDEALLLGQTRQEFCESRHRLHGWEITSTSMKVVRS